MKAPMFNSMKAREGEYSAKVSSAKVGGGKVGEGSGSWCDRDTTWSASRFRLAGAVELLMCVRFAVEQ